MFDMSRFKGGNFLAHVDLPQPSQDWTLSKVEEKEVGEKKDLKACVTFAEFPNKPLALNKGNLNALCDEHSLDGHQWSGKRMRVYRAETKFAGKDVLCIRLCPADTWPSEKVYDKLGNEVTRPAEQNSPPSE